MVLALVAEHWEPEPDYENICAKLNCGESHNEKYVQLAYLNTPLFRGAEELIDAGTIVLGGMRQQAGKANLDIAEAYKAAGDELVRVALSLDSVQELSYPILFSYRHALEVYLKLVVPQKDDTHDFTRLINALESKHLTPFAQWARDRLLEFHQMDPFSDTFRYAEGRKSLPADELTVNVRQLRVVVNRLCSGLKEEVLRGATSL